MSVNLAPKHGSPRDRGSMDRYYNRSYEPHWYPKGSYIGKRVDIEDMTKEEIFEYHAGFLEETDRKRWT